MPRSFLALAAALPLALTLQPAAAGEPATVKVALTDMSSTMGAGRGPGGGPGWGMMGPGMMGWGWDAPGRGGGWTMGPGMMMAHGMMAIRIDHDTVPAGEVRFDVTNWSRGLVHELLVIPVADPAAPLPYDHAEGKVAESQVRVLADSGDLPPSASHLLEVTLAPGTYLLVCNLQGHYAAGMVVPLTVVPAGGGTPGRS
ncbi:hypothetical protein QMO56_02920 [Roseomonas sp. E05]|uniref:hypothetical protein n=1 Tax=Roseomonas sp. E05 TaxID=3046310 RepID=UPI0024BA85AA|nr:hypothetical protein [Roseomonas sp. E05]MDJ0387055.1 hypothetical protein [Roseomonas sp. E05]